jgi:hypothetical protein
MIKEGCPYPVATLERDELAVLSMLYIQVA